MDKVHVGIENWDVLEDSRKDWNRMEEKHVEEDNNRDVHCDQP